MHVVTDYLAGGNLLENLARRHRYSEADAAHIAAEMACALAALHAMSPPVVHRDVKLENVMLRRPVASDEPLKISEVVLVDFGCALAAGDQDPFAAGGGGRGGSVGTPAYLAPEALEEPHGSCGQRFSPATDAWALGVLLHTLLAGTFPFAAPSRSAEVALVRRGTRGRLPDGTSPAARALVAGLLRVPPPERSTCAAAEQCAWARGDAPSCAAPASPALPATTHAGP